MTAVAPATAATGMTAVSGAYWALSEHEPGVLQCEGAAAQRHGRRLDEQLVETGHPGGAEAGDHQQRDGRTEPRTGGERGQRREDQQAGTGDDAPLEASGQHAGDDEIG
jgi:hypothetical protein